MSVYKQKELTDDQKRHIELSHEERVIHRQWLLEEAARKKERAKWLRSDWLAYIGHLELFGETGEATPKGCCPDDLWLPYLTAKRNARPRYGEMCKPKYPRQYHPRYQSY